LNVTSKLIEGAGGVFDVHVDGAQIWSKHDVGRFPEHNEVLDKIRATSGKAR
jgi:selT/selW/selH-like putative selenoprotein